MVWRALLAAAVVTCMLTRVHAQTPPRLDQIKDILCVLLLSGIQKEDLAESTLQKLQRHNVNINDLNNEELRKECRNIDVNMEHDITTTEKYLILETVEFENEKREKNIHTIKNNINNKKKGYYSTINASLRKYIDDKEIQIKSQENKQREKKLYDIALPKKNNVMKNNAEDTYIINLTTIISNILTKILDENQIKASTQQTIRNIDSASPYFQNTPDNNPKNIYEQLIANNKFVVESLANRGNPKTEIPQMELQYHTEQNDIKIPNEHFQITMPENRRFYVPGGSFPNRELEQKNDLHKAEPLKLPNVIPVNVINDIAERLKVIILKDLKKELNIEQYRTTTIGPTTTTRLTSTTTIIKKGHTTSSNIGKDMVIDEMTLQNFLKLFEQMNNIKSNSTYKQYEMGTNSETKSKKVLENPKVKTTNGILNVNQIPKKLYSNYNFRPQMHKYRSQIVDVKNVMPDIKQSVPNKGKPVTFQTNLLEIPPLGIMLDRFQNPINQNIILTTSAYKLTDLINLNLKKNTKSERFKYYSPNDEDNGENNFYAQESIKYIRDDIKNEKDDSDFMNKRNERIINVSRVYENLDEDVKMRADFEEKFNLDQIDCCQKKHISQLIEDCCNDRIKSRKQISLNNLKNRKSDDSHIKNFINSQRKVNDMLEKLLATRKKYRSIEQV